MTEQTPDSISQQVVDEIKRRAEARGTTMEALLKGALDTQVGMRAVRSSDDDSDTEPTE